MKKLCSVLFILIFSVSLFAGEYQLNSDNSVSELNISTLSPTQIEVKAEIDQLSFFNVNTDQGDFTQISIAKFHFTNEVGNPKLPVMNKMIEIPLGKDLDFSFEIIDYDETVISLEEMGIDNPIFPAQAPLSKSADPNEIQFQYNAQEYSVDGFNDIPMVDVEIRGIMRNTRLALLTINPVRYNPDQGLLKIYNNIEVMVNFENADLFLTENVKRNFYSPYFDKALSNITNYTLPGDKDDLTQYPVKYVIIADPMFEAQLQPFIEWKTEKGYSVVEKYTGDPDVGTTTSSIQTYLHGLYNAGTVSDPAPSFVLFVGDVGQIPSFSGTTGGHITDLYYCDVTDDMIPDMYHGRFSAQTTGELQPQIDKTLAMEKLDVSDDSFAGKTVLIAGWDSAHSVDWGYPQINYGTENYFNAEHNFTDVYVYLSSGSGQNEAAIISNVSDGVTFVNYTAHGSSYSWADPGFTISDINSLQNVDKYATVVGNCCLTNTFENSECFGEAWLRAEDKGAVGYIGGTNSTYWDEDLWWGVGYYTIQTGQGGAPPAYEETGMGAYDGSFVFDYNTQAAMILAGNLAVEESNSSRKDYYWEIYELMGDPSYMTIMGLPQQNMTSLPSIIAVGANSMSVNADVGSHIAISKDGVLHGSMYKENPGSVVMTFDAFTSPGTAKIVITAQNREPVIQTLPIIVPSVVEFDPTAININEETSVTVTVYEADGTTPIPDVNVWVDGWGVDPEDLTGVTNSSGEVIFSINAPFGEMLSVTGKRDADDYFLFSEQLGVAGGTALTTPNISASVESIGLFGSLAPYYEGQISSICGEEGIDLAAVGCGIDTSVADTFMLITPHETGEMTAAITKSGYNVYEEVIDVEVVYGTLNGVVKNDADEGIAGAEVKTFLLPDLANPVFTAITNAVGNFSIEGDLEIGNYQVEVNKFGYLLYNEEHFLQYGQNNWTLAMVNAPQGVVTGTVTETGTGTPLDAAVNIYRETPEGNILHSTVNAIATNGGEFSVTLPYYTYLFKVTAMQHIPMSLTVLVDGAMQTANFTLDPTSGNILVIDDDSGERSINKVVDSEGNLISEETVMIPAEKGEAASAISEALMELGYFVVVENSGSSDPDDWFSYDLVINSSGSNSDPINDETYQTNLMQYVAEGGKLFIEGGEIGYNLNGNTAFAANVLHINDWETDNAGALNQEISDHAISITPNSLPAQINIDYGSYGDEDACTPTSDAYIVYSNNSNSGHGGIIVYDDNEVDISAQIVFFSCAYNAITGDDTRDNMLENIVLYLITPEIQGTGVLSGNVDLMDTDIDAGAKVEILGTNFETYSDANGNYVINHIYPGNFSVRATRFGYCSQSIGDVTVANDSNTVDVNFELQPLVLTFFDDFESGLTLWNLEKPWGLTEEDYSSSSHSLTDSPDGNYSGNAMGWSAASAIPVDMQLCSEGLLRFWHKYDIGEGDMAHVEVSADGSFWQLVETFEGSQCWQQANLNLTPFANLDFMWMRFRMTSNSSDNLDGWYIDDVEVLLDAGNFLLKGDVNQDGVITVGDIIMTVSFVLNTDAPSPVEFWCADMNEDAQLTVLDIVKIVQIILNDTGLARTSANPAGKVELFQRGDKVYCKSDGDIGGLEIHFAGAEKNSLNFSQKIAMDKVVSYNLEQSVALLYSIEGNTIPAGERELLTIPEGTEIQSVVAADPQGNKIETVVRLLPVEFALRQNYPNPFNPTTKIAFDVPEASNVKIIIYDMLGKEVRELKNRNFEPGKYEAVWDARNNQGANVSSGIYFYILKTPGFEKMKKMVLIR